MNGIVSFNFIIIIINCVVKYNIFLALREEARLLGSAIDTKLHALNKYATTGRLIPAFLLYKLKVPISGPRYKAVENSHFNRSKRSAFIQDAQEVEELLKQLEEANRKVNDLFHLCVH